MLYDGGGCLGNASMCLDRLEEAAGMIRRAVEGRKVPVLHHPRLLGSLKQLGTMYMNQRRVTSAEKTLNKF